MPSLLDIYAKSYKKPLLQHKPGKAELSDSVQECDARMLNRHSLPGSQKNSADS